MLVRLAAEAPLLAGADAVAFVDVDSNVNAKTCETQYDTEGGRPKLGV